MRQCNANWKAILEESYSHWLKTILSWKCCRCLPPIDGGDITLRTDRRCYNHYCTCFRSGRPCINCSCGQCCYNTEEKKKISRERGNNTKSDQEEKKSEQENEKEEEGERKNKKKRSIVEEKKNEQEINVHKEDKEDQAVSQGNKVNEKEEQEEQKNKKKRKDNEPDTEDSGDPIINLDDTNGFERSSSL